MTILTLLPPHFHYFLCVVLRIKPRALFLGGRSSTTEYNYVWTSTKHYI